MNEKNKRIKKDFIVRQIFKLKNVHVIDVYGKKGGHCVVNIKKRKFHFCGILTPQR